MAAPRSGTQAPGCYRQKVGDYEVTVVIDGTFALDATMFTGDEAGVEKLFSRRSFAQDGVHHAAQHLADQYRAKAHPG